MYVLHTNVDEVILSGTVIDDKGRMVDDLNQSEFRVWKDGVPQTINSVQRQEAFPFRWASLSTTPVPCAISVRRSMLPHMTC